MAEGLLVLGETGTGKSRSIKNLDPKKTFLINVYGKALPFKGWKKNYIDVRANQAGNMAISDNVNGILKSMDHAVEMGYRTILIDDYQFVAGMRTIRDAKVKGYDKFTDIAQGFVAISDKVKTLPENVTVVFLSHVEADGNGGTKAKTAGLMVDKVIGLESLFTMVLQTEVEEGQYYFLTQNNGHNTVKSPEGMFNEMKIPNDLRFVLKSLYEYNNADADEIEEVNPVETQPAMIPIKQPLNQAPIEQPAVNEPVAEEHVPINQEIPVVNWQDRLREIIKENKLSVRITAVDTEESVTARIETALASKAQAEQQAPIEESTAPTQQEAPAQESTIMEKRPNDAGITFAHEAKAGEKSLIEKIQGAFRNEELMFGYLHERTMLRKDSNSLADLSLMVRKQIELNWEKFTVAATQYSIDQA